MSNEEQGFLQAIQNNPTDNSARLVYADWLEQRQDPRAEFVRVQAQIQDVEQRRKDVRRSLRKLEATLDQNWLREMRGVFCVRFVSYHEGCKLRAIAAVMDIRNGGLKAGKDFVERADERVIQDDLTAEKALTIAAQFKWTGEVVIEPYHPTTARRLPEPPCQVRILSYDPNRREQILELVHKLADSDLDLPPDSSFFFPWRSVIRKGLTPEEAKKMVSRFEGIAEAVIEPSGHES